MAALGAQTIQGLHRRMTLLCILSLILFQEFVDEYYLCLIGEQMSLDDKVKILEKFKDVSEFRGIITKLCH